MFKIVSDEVIVSLLMDDGITSSTGLIRFQILAAVFDCWLNFEWKSILSNCSCYHWI